MELDGFWFSIMQFQQFSNYLLRVGGPRVKLIIITPTKKVQNSAKISGRVDRASATETIDLGSIHSRVKPKTIKIGIHSFPA